MIEILYEFFVMDGGYDGFMWWTCVGSIEERCYGAWSLEKGLDVAPGGSWACSYCVTCLNIKFDLYELMNHHGIVELLQYLY